MKKGEAGGASIDEVEGRYMVIVMDMFLKGQEDFFRLGRGDRGEFGIMVGQP